MENEKGIVKLTRKQLYDEIWALSVAGVARKYNLNYGKLIATCKVENISFPSSGYWTKKNMGKDVSNEIVEFSGLEDTEISLITKDAVVKRIRKEQCSVCGKNHNIVCINDNTTIKEFSYNYYIPKESGCSWSEDERYCVLVKWEDFKNDPETYIDNAFNKRKSEISKKTKVRP